MTDTNRLLKELQRKDLAKNITEARKWIKNKVIELQNQSHGKLIRDISRRTTKFQLGAMYFFHYDPKTKEKLLFYDLFPLVIPIETYSDGFLGLNLHYIPPYWRVRLLDQLIRFEQNDRLAVSYQMAIRWLPDSVQNNLFKPCVKKYLITHIRSHFLRIDRSEWNTAAYLPVEQFVYN